MSACQGLQIQVFLGGMARDDGFWTPHLILEKKATQDKRT